jgi:hypothetical protein
LTPGTIVCVELERRRNQRLTTRLSTSGPENALKVEKKMSDQKSVDRSAFLDQIGFGFVEDGRIVELHLIRKSGKTAYVPVEFSDLSNVVLRIQEAAGQAWDLQKQALGGVDPRLVHPMTVSVVDSLQGAYSTSGEPIMTVVLKSGLRIDLRVRLEDIPGLIEWLEELQASPVRGEQPQN